MSFDTGKHPAIKLRPYRMKYKAVTPQCYMVLMLQG